MYVQCQTCLAHFSIFVLIFLNHYSIEFQYHFFLFLPQADGSNGQDADLEFVLQCSLVHLTQLWVSQFTSLQGWFYLYCDFFLFQFLTVILFLLPCLSL